MNGDNTKEGKQTYSVKSTVAIHVVAGQAQPLKASVALKDTTWHPKDPNKQVNFTEKSMKISSAVKLDIVPGGLVTATFVCNPDPILLVGAVSAQPGQDTTPPTTAGGPVTTAAVTTTVVTDPNSANGGGSLPRTGANWVLLLVLAAAAIDIGIVMVGATRRRFRHR